MSYTNAEDIKRVIIALESTKELKSVGGILAPHLAQNATNRFSKVLIIPSSIRSDTIVLTIVFSQLLKRQYIK